MGPIRVHIGMTDEAIEQAVAAAAEAPTLPEARTAQYLAEARLLLLCLKNEQRLAIPVEDLEDLQGASDENLSEVELHGSGAAIHFPSSGTASTCHILQREATEARSGWSS